jgi:hypothetical protein
MIQLAWQEHYDGSGKGTKTTQGSMLMEKENEKTLCGIPRRNPSTRQSIHTGTISPKGI